MDKLIDKRFTDCCGAGPLELRIERGSTVIAAGRLDQPFAVIGRDPHCDVHLNDPAVALRHAFAQVVHGHLFVFDLASTTGVHWPGGRQGSGWLAPGEPLHIGPFRLVFDIPAASPANFDPLAACADGFPPVLLEFHNGRSERSGWQVDRPLTLVGRAGECKLHLSGEDIGLFHAYLVRTLLGLWVVDLLARGGTSVNGRKVRAALLANGDELNVGRFVMGVKYPPGPPTGGSDSAVSFDVTRPDDTGSLAVQSSARIGRSTETMPSPEAPPDDFAPLVAAPLANDDRLLLRQMAEMQAAMFAQFQHSLTVMMQAIEEINPNHAQALQNEMTRLAELNSELATIQVEILKPALPLHVNLLPDPESVPPMTAASADAHEAVWQRLEKLHGERLSLWQRLRGR